MTAGSAGTPQRVLLIVDDDDDVAAVLERIFVPRGWRVHRARSGSDALAVLGGGQWVDTAIVDLVLPGVGGLEVVKSIRGRFPSCRIVGLTGLPPDAAARAFSQAGADAFVSKPFELEDIVAAVENLAPPI